MYLLNQYSAGLDAVCDCYSFIGPIWTDGRPERSYWTVRFHSGRSKAIPIYISTSHLRKYISILVPIVAASNVPPTPYRAV
jgi:hypothetical protein